MPSNTPLSDAARAQLQEQGKKSLADANSTTSNVDGRGPTGAFGGPPPTAGPAKTEGNQAGALPGTVAPSKAAEANANKRAGVGGEVNFRLAVAKKNAGGGYEEEKDTGVQIELAPARRSFMDKQGQHVPGAGAGLEITIRNNLAKLNVPGSRPIYQHMGIAEECIEWVGAFVGHDHWEVDGNGDDVWEGGNHKRVSDAWQQSADLMKVFSPGRELILTLEWPGDLEDKEDDQNLMFNNSVKYRGHFKEIKRVYATAQRVYYAVSFVVTNREDVNGAKRSGKDLAIPLPDRPNRAQGKVVAGLGSSQGVGVSQPTQEPGKLDPNKTAKPTEDQAKAKHDTFVQAVNDLYNEMAPLIPGDGLERRYRADINKLKQYYAANYTSKGTRDASIEATFDKIEAHIKEDSGTEKFVKGTANLLKRGAKGALNAGKAVVNALTTPRAIDQLDK